MLQKLLQNCLEKTWKGVAGEGRYIEKVLFGTTTILLRTFKKRYILEFLHILGKNFMFFDLF